MDIAEHMEIPLDTHENDEDILEREYDEDDEPQFLIKNLETDAPNIEQLQHVSYLKIGMMIKYTYFIIS